MEKAKKKLAKFKEKETVLEEFNKSIADAEIAKGYLLSHGVRQLPGQPNATAGEETRYAFAAAHPNLVFIISFQFRLWSKIK